MGGGGAVWAIVVPVKRLTLAKTRLAVPAELRAELALAMAVDTVRAAVQAPGVAQVVVVTDDPTAAGALTDVGARVVADTPDAGLNPALEHGAAAALRGDARRGVGKHGAAGRRAAALSSDLPALRASDLAAVLAAAAEHDSCVVGDAAGTGTTIFAAAHLGAFRPAFGSQSRRVHVEAGAVDLTDVAGPSLRRDVDILADLAAAATLGCGAATAAVIANHPRLLDPGTTAGADPGRMST